MYKDASYESDSEPFPIQLHFRQKRTFDQHNPECQRHFKLIF